MNYYDVFVIVIRGYEKTHMVRAENIGEAAVKAHRVFGPSVIIVRKASPQEIAVLEDIERKAFAT